MSSPTPAPAPAAAPATTTVVEEAPAASSAPAPATSTIPEQPAPKRSLTDKLLGRIRPHDVEKLSPAEEDAETKKKRRRAAAGILGSLCGLLTALTFLSLFGLGMYFLSAYTMPMLICKMHGYSSQCMFNAYDKSGTSVGEWFSKHLPDGFGRGFHDKDW